MSRGDKSPMQSKPTPRRTRYVPLILLGGAIIALLIFGPHIGLSFNFIVPAVTVLCLVLGAAALWTHANLHATGDEWWQDDSADGWRNYD